MNSHFWKEWGLSVVLSTIGLGLAYIVGGFTGLYLASILAVLEVSLSFDNAVVNAKILEGMDEVWQKRFLTWGIIIAVFGMRFLFPLIIVGIASHTNIIQALDLALNHPNKYKEILENTINYVYAFGGSFLLMVALDFFFDNDKDEFWIRWIENNKLINSLGKIDAIELIITTGIGLVLTYITKDYLIALSYFSGMLLHALINSIDEMLGTDGVKNGLIGLLYLEILDASFSFDGVIGAFAISMNVIIIMLGLGIGALFVRSLTLHFVRTKKLSEYPLLEHGAHYAILTLAVIMFLEIFHHIPEIVSGTIGIAFITASFASSLKRNKDNAKRNLSSNS